jgi:hypothetical protein
MVLNARRLVRFAVVLSMVFLAHTAGALAQDAVVTTTAPIYIYPDATRSPLRTAAVNTRLRVLEEEKDGWIRVEFQDPQFGRRVGYIEAKNVRVTRPEQIPMDLSVTPRPEPPPREPEAPAPVATARTAAPSPRFRRGWVDVSLGVAMARQKTYSTSYDFELFDEPASGKVDYRLPTGAEFDFGGGVLLTRNFGIGISFVGTAHEDIAGLSLRIPHPIYANAYATDSKETDSPLRRVESVTNIQAVIVQDVTPAVRFRLLAGPSLFRAQQDVVTAIRFDQAFLIFSSANAIDITTYKTERVGFDGVSGWGVHVGGDVSWFFSGVVGVGGFARYSTGTVEFADPLTEKTVTLKTGGFQAGGGLRLRF